MKKPELKNPPPQHQERQPGREHEMQPRPESSARRYQPANKLRDRVALITGGDSGIGRAVALAMAREGAHLSIVYLEETEDAQQTRREVEQLDRRCLLLAGDIGDPAFCRRAVEQTVKELGRLDILVNHAGEQHVQSNLEEIGDEQLERTFRTNVFSQFYLTRAALPHLKEGSTIINTASVTAYKGHPLLIDYSASNGARVSFTRSLALSLGKRKIRVNAVAPGPIWTPLIPATFPAEMVEEFGAGTTLGRPGQPDELAASYVFLACEDSSYMTGQVLHPNGGYIVNG